MTQDYKHPITPPPELVQQWASEWMQQQSLNRDNFMATRASQYGADQELEACCEWLKLEGHEYEHEALLVARRPKPPSLKEQALEALDHIEFGYATGEFGDTIRRALEQLPDPS
jgi:hypothetical protein